MKHYSQHIQAYISDELDSRSRAEMEAHLAGCSTCARELAEQRVLWESLDSLAAPAAGASVWPSVQARTTRSAKGWFFGSTGWARSGLAAAAVAAGLMLGVLIPGGGGVGAGDALATDLDEAETLWISGTTLEDGQSDLEALWFQGEETASEEGQDS